MRFFVFLLLIPFSGWAQSFIIPQPANIEWKNGKYNLPKNCYYFTTSKNPALLRTIDLVSNEFATQFNIQLKPTNQSATAQFHISEKSGKAVGAHAYDLLIADNGINITAQNAESFFHASRTLLQLLTPQPGNEIKLPLVHIEDHPRFAYRGMHLDVGRHFFPVSFIKNT